MKIPFRQGIVQYQTDSANTQQFLQRSGTAVSLAVSPTPTIVAFAHLDTDYLYTEGLSVPNAWAGPFVPGTDYWLYWDINMLTGVRTFGSTTIAPIVSAKMPAPALVGQHWFDTIRHTMNVWNGSYWNVVVRVFAAKYTAAASFDPVSTTAKGFTGSQVGDNSTSRPGALVFDVMGKPLKTSTGTFYTTETGVAVSGLASAVKMASVILDAEAQEPIPAYSAVYFSDFDKINLCKPYTADTLPYGIVEVDMVQGTITNVITSGIVINNRWNWSKVNAPVYIGTDGSLVTTPVYGSQTSIGFVLDRNAVVLHQTATNINGPAGPMGPAGPQGPAGTGGGGGSCPSKLVEYPVPDLGSAPNVAIDGMTITTAPIGWYITNAQPGTTGTVTRTGLPPGAPAGTLPTQLGIQTVTIDKNGNSYWLSDRYNTFAGWTITWTFVVTGINGSSVTSTISATIVAP